MKYKLSGLCAWDKAGVKVDSSRLVVSDRAHMLFDLHKEVDGLREAELSGNKIGTTKRGIGPAYASKVGESFIMILHFNEFVTSHYTSRHTSQLSVTPRFSTYAP